MTRGPRGAPGTATHSKRSAPAARRDSSDETKRANTVNRIGAFKAARKRMPKICALLLVCLALPAHLAAQTVADREAVARVMDRLIPSDRERPGSELASYPETWSLVIARFAKGDSREVGFPAEATERYRVIGATGSPGTDIDICIYGPGGNPVDCDTLDDSLPIVSFTAKTAGTYRAVLTAVSVEGGGTSFAGMVVLRRLEQAAERGGAGK